MKRRIGVMLIVILVMTSIMAEAVLAESMSPLDRETIYRGLGDRSDWEVPETSVTVDQGDWGGMWITYERGMFGDVSEIENGVRTKAGMYVRSRMVAYEDKAYDIYNEDGRQYIVRKNLDGEVEKVISSFKLTPYSKSNDEYTEGVYKNLAVNGETIYYQRIYSKYNNKRKRHKDYTKLYKIDIETGEKELIHSYSGYDKELPYFEGKTDDSIIMRGAKGKHFILGKKIKLPKDLMDMYGVIGDCLVYGSKERTKIRRDHKIKLYNVKTKKKLYIGGDVFTDWTPVGKDKLFVYELVYRNKYPNVYRRFKIIDLNTLEVIKQNSIYKGDPYMRALLDPTGLHSIEVKYQHRKADVRAIYVPYDTLEPIYGEWYDDEWETMITGVEYLDFRKDGVTPKKLYRKHKKHYNADQLHELFGMPGGN